MKRARSLLFPASLWRAGAALLAASQCLACADTGQSPVSFSLRAGGHNIDAPIEGRDGWQIDLSRAQLAFGPLALCPGAQAGNLCEVASAEWLGSAVIDVLNEQPRTLGRVDGVSGMTRSWMYDLGIVSTLTTEEPLMLGAAEQLGGNSVVLAGAAERDGERVSFEARLRLQQDATNEIGVPIIRKSTSEFFEHDIDEDTRALVVTFDASSWLQEVDFEAVQNSCEPATASTVCEFEADSQGQRAIRNELLAGARPSFAWE